MILPDYLHIGYSKAASTWLQGLLRNEEDVFLVYKSDFFFPLNSGGYEKGLEYYSSFFKDAGNSKIKIESHEHIILPFHHPQLKCASTNLEVVETAAKRIKNNLPGIKIILIIRNQADMLLSRYTQYILQGGKLSASEFLNRLAFENDNYLEYVDYRYSKVIRLLFDVFGEPNVLVLFQEELNRRPEKFLDSLSRFFNHTFAYSPGGMKRKNPAPSFRGVKLLRLVNKLLVKEVETIESRTKTRGPWLIWFLLTRTVRYLDRFLVKKKNKKRLFTPGEIQKIKDIFKEDNKTLAGMFDQPVLEYGYHYDR